MTCDRLRWLITVLAQNVRILSYRRLTLMNSTKRKFVYCMLVTSSPYAVRLSWLENAYSCPLFRQAMFTHKVGQTDLVLVCDQGSLVGLCVKNFKSLRATVTICTALVNTQIRDTQTDSILTSLYE